LRGQMARRRLWGRLDHIYSNMPSIIRVQAIWRGRQQREKYRKIISGQDIDIAAIQNYMHLLDDSENDFNEQVQIERMRKQVVERIRNNQLLESQVTELDNKIALILQNKLSFEDLVRVKGRINTASEMKEEQQTFNLGRSDPFSRDAHLDKSLWHRRELYQRMFFILQTEPKYLARLLRLQTASEASEQDRRLLQSVVLALFSYGQGRREEYLLLKMLQVRRCRSDSSITDYSPSIALDSRADSMRSRAGTANHNAPRFDRRCSHFHPTQQWCRPESHIRKAGREYSQRPGIGSMYRSSLSEFCAGMYLSTANLVVDLPPSTER
jgi:hypothetical protein